MEQKCYRFFCRNRNASHDPVSSSSYALVSSWLYKVTGGIFDLTIVRGMNSIWLTPPSTEATLMRSSFTTTMLQYYPIPQLVCSTTFYKAGHFTDLKIAFIFGFQYINLSRLPSCIFERSCQFSSPSALRFSCQTPLFFIDTHKCFFFCNLIQFDSLTIVHTLTELNLPSLAKASSLNFRLSEANCLILDTTQINLKCEKLARLFRQAWSSHWPLQHRDRKINSSFSNVNTKLHYSHPLLPSSCIKSIWRVKGPCTHRKALGNQEC